MTGRYIKINERYWCDVGNFGCLNITIFQYLIIEIIGLFSFQAFKWLVLWINYTILWVSLFKLTKVTLK